MGFAENIKRLRESKGLTQEDIAKIAGVSFQAVSTWESGKKNPRIGAVEKLCVRFNLKKSDLIDDRESDSSPPPKTKTPKDLDEFLQQADIMFKGVPLSDDAKEGVRKILGEVHSMAKDMNKRKK